MRPISLLRLAVAFIGLAAFLGAAIPLLAQESEAEDLGGHAFGETSSLRPRWKDPAGPKKESNYDPASADQLHEARKAICEVIKNRIKQGWKRGSRKKVPTPEELENPNTDREWKSCVKAANAAISQPKLNEHCKHFYLRKGTKRTGQDGPYEDRPSWAGDNKPDASFGPFRNLGGGDVAEGEDVYVDVYCGIR